MKRSLVARCIGGPAPSSLAAFLALSLVAILALSLFASTLRAARAEGYSAQERTAYVRRALTSLEALGEARDRLEAELATAARQRCGGSGSQTPRLPCLLDLAQKLCVDPSLGLSLGLGDGGAAVCAAAADVILVNLRSAGELVDEPTRVRLVRSATDYHAALLAELRKRYAALAAELVIEDPDAAAELPAAAASIDRFCARRDHRPKPPRCDEPSPTCVPSLSWQRCVAALAWFVVAPGAPPLSPSPPSAPAKESTP